MTRVCVVGCGAIGSLYAAHLARVAEVWAFVRREDKARDLKEKGLTVSGRHEFHAAVKATTKASEVPECEWAIIATKATQVTESICEVGPKFDRGAVDRKSTRLN